MAAPDGTKEIGGKAYSTRQNTMEQCLRHVRVADATQMGSDSCPLKQKLHQTGWREDAWYAWRVLDTEEWSVALASTAARDDIAVQLWWPAVSFHGLSYALEFCKGIDLFKAYFISCESEFVWSYNKQIYYQCMPTVFHVWLEAVSV